MEVTSNVISNILTKPIIIKQLFIQQSDMVSFHFLRRYNARL